MGDRVNFTRLDSGTMININANIIGRQSGGGAPASTLLNGLVHVWKFDETGTSTSDLRMDSVGSDDLTPTATVMTPSAGKSELSYTNDGSARYLNVDSESLRNLPDSSFTFSVWINLNTINSNSPIFASWNAFQNDRGYLLLYSASFGLRWIASSDGTVFVDAINNTISANTWHHVVCWFDKVEGKIKMSVNNDTEITRDVSIIHASSYPFLVGAFLPGSGTMTDYLNGQIDEFYCWNRVITPEERSELYNTGAGKFYPFT